MFTRTAELYDLFYERKDYASEAERIHQIVAARAPDARTLLDVACGTGRHLEHLRRWYGVEGLDLDEGLLEVARGRIPDVRLHVADMRRFDLGRHFDVVTCLFSSIGYCRSYEEMRAAVGAMARHLTAGGVLMVEPWLTAEVFDPGRVIPVIAVERPDLVAVRMNDSSVEDGLSVLNFHYLVRRRGKPVEHLVETHALGLFSDEQHRAAFESAGLSVEHDPEGLIGRGLWIGRAPA